MKKMKNMNKMMNDLLLKVYIKAQILKEDSGQDLVEYSLIAALIAFGTVAGMNGLSDQINVAFSRVGSKVISAVGS